jgi:hypothetical protein
MDRSAAGGSLRLHIARRGLETSRSSAAGRPARKRRAMQRAATPLRSSGTDRTGCRSSTRASNRVQDTLPVLDLLPSSTGCMARALGPPGPSSSLRPPVVGAADVLVCAPVPQPAADTPAASLERCWGGNVPLGAPETASQALQALLGAWLVFLGAPKGELRESNPRPLAPKARIMPLDQTP